ncbi:MULTISPECIES: cbb3-type cytochrome oxidase assembly protein CcoS [unclassified Lysobacter]|uniref:cbb3-type cytochrome oxidase assembly protein CcoS n=1 Tax=unclassified Lysobacter TaxID=2635362 RepID=UPI001C243BC3|nr:cbb3-type cytochrome oxidase assembly protein CcoS [Lysobacter sp. MMG2]MBU8975800.1 cbb3-type cytochrome oxidase assembly protein CcoS [Lysobacter sp. MMG2]
MNILLLLVPISLVLLGIAIGAFVWAVRRGQFDDLDTPAIDILRDDPLPMRAPERAIPNDDPPRHDD